MGKYALIILTFALASCVSPIEMISTWGDDPYNFLNKKKGGVIRYKKSHGKQAKKKAHRYCGGFYEFIEMNAAEKNSGEYLHMEFMCKQANSKGKINTDGEFPEMPAEN